MNEIKEEDRNSDKERGLSKGNERTMEKETRHNSFNEEKMSKQNQNINS